MKGRSAIEAEKLARALQERFKGHKITPVAQVSKVMQENATGLKQFKEALTGMAVVISFLVVLLAMYTTIIERTREIGILRAIGASQAKVVQLVIAESFLICLAGVVLGIAFAVGAPLVPAQHLPHPDRRAHPGVGASSRRPSAWRAGCWARSTRRGRPPAWIPSRRSTSSRRAAPRSGVDHSRSRL